MNRPAIPCTAYPPALPNGSPVDTYASISFSSSAANVTAESSTAARVPLAGNRSRKIPVSTWCVRPLSFWSISRAWAASRGLPRISPSSSTVVSAPITIRSVAASLKRAAAARAFASASRATMARAVSPGRAVSSTCVSQISNAIPASRRISARRGDADARTSFIQAQVHMLNSNVANLAFGMQAREATAHLIQPLFAKDFLDAREHLVFLEPHVIVEELSDPRHFFRWNLVLGREALLEIQNGGANLGVIAEEPHDICIPINPLMPRVGGEQYFFFLAKMHLPRLVPESNKFLCLPRNGSRAPFRRCLRRTAHLQRPHHCKMMVLAKRMQTRMALHAWTRGGKLEARVYHRARSTEGVRG